MPKKLTMRAVKQIDTSDQKGRDIEYYKEMIPQLQKLVHSQIKVVERGGHYPYALREISDPEHGKYILNKETGKREKQIIGDLTSKKVTDNVAHMSQLFTQLVDALQAETSTVAGAERVEKKQDVQLFGAYYQKRRGRTVEVAKRRMTGNERKKFWDAYDEFLNQNQDMLHKYLNVMDALSDMQMSGREIDYQDTTLLNDILERISKERAIDPEEWKENRGRGNTHAESVFSYDRNKR